MPFVDITTNESIADMLAPKLPEMRHFIAKRLSCGDRILRDDEVSLRIVKPYHALSIADIEVVMNAYSYPERVENQDLICKDVQEFIAKYEIGSVYAWLQLSELGHSGE